MPRLHHVKKARKDNPVVKAGEEYWWWKFAFRPKYYSATKPRRSQLTRSAFLSQLWDIEDETWNTPEALISVLEDLQSGCEYSLCNMPEHLQDTSTSGELLQSRIDNLEVWMCAIQDLADSDDECEDISVEMLALNPGFE